MRTGELEPSVTGRSLMAGFASPMCSYNLVNGKYPCENNHTVKGILKIELGFQGFVFPREPHTVLVQ